MRPFIVLTLGVGLHSLAVKHYESVLEIAERRTRTNPDVGPTSYQHIEWTVTLAPGRILDYPGKPPITYPSYSLRRVQMP